MQPDIGTAIRIWRRRRRLSQLDLALNAGVSQRHLSFIESNRASPSRSMVLRLAEQLDLPMRQQNELLLAAGFAPEFSETPLSAEKSSQQRETLELLLAAHSPFPAFVLDRHWSIVAANPEANLFVNLAREPQSFTQPLNALRLALHPDGLASRIENLAELRHHLLQRLQRQVRASADLELERLLAEANQWPSAAPKHNGSAVTSDLVVPIVLNTPIGWLRFYSTVTVFGAPQDVILSELALEAFYPADGETRARLTEIQKAVTPVAR
jgi:transcriptional regulator with XRE-family HTH domain